MKKRYISAIVVVFAICVIAKTVYAVDGSSQNILSEKNILNLRKIIQ